MTFAAEVSVAVAANFALPMQKIAAAFEQETGHKARLSFGSTGNFYAQVRHGAPFQVFLSADDATPARLQKEGQGVAGSSFTYAIGKLVLWSKRPGVVDERGDVLRSANQEKIALANPKLAPYGAAAMQTMTRLGVLQRLQSRFVQGENISQTYQFVASENALIGFVALSQVFVDGQLREGSAWIVPPALYTPLRQDALLLAKGKDNPAALALMTFLRSVRAQNIVRSYGYDL